MGKAKKLHVQQRVCAVCVLCVCVAHVLLHIWQKPTQVNGVNVNNALGSVNLDQARPANGTHQWTRCRPPGSPTKCGAPPPPLPWLVVILGYFEVLFAVPAWRLSCIRLHLFIMQII